MSRAAVISRFASAAAAVIWLAYCVDVVGGELGLWLIPNITLGAPAAMFMAAVFTLHYAVKG